MTPPVTNHKKTQINAWFLAREASATGLIIALPLVFFIWLGHAIDQLIGVRAVLVFVGLVLALIVSGTTLYHRIKSWL